ncbi:histidine phosphatase superfamily [Cyathus striatus]|nr:histidine phosphatase superfamily [Cyathus striatus]
MLGKQDVESVPEGSLNEGYKYPDHEREALLPIISNTYLDDKPPSSTKSSPTSTTDFNTRKRSGAAQVPLAFIAGILVCLLGQVAVYGTNCFSRNISQLTDVHVNASPEAGSTKVHNYPPANPTNAFPSLFPSNVGYPGGTPTGAEAAVIATAPSYPIHSGAAQLVSPESLGKKHKGKKGKNFDLFKNWGNLSPWYSIEQGAFGVNSGPETPKTCRITGLHFLHRHGARYPSSWGSYGGPANFSSRLHNIASEWNGKGELEFMNDWTYKLGEELLTPFGRQQLFDLGISLRLKYGFLLENFTATNTIPVFRTESQDRMVQSALNFAVGFFGFPVEEKYQQSITIESAGFNNTLAPYKTCPNANSMSKAERGSWYLRRWADIYLKDALKRLRPQFQGYELSAEDLYAMQQLCAYETVALGYSKFCELFTEKEWEGFDYALDLYFWYGSAFGSPVARVQGIGYVQEMVARLTHTPIETHNSSTNATLNDNPITFPLNDSLYVDATHEVVILNIITALNLTSFAAGGPLPYTHIPKKRTFRVTELAPFATNVQFQLLECTSLPGPQIRVIINDGVTPLTGIRGCPKQKDGMCPVDTFVAAQKEIIGKTDWVYGCYGNWTVPEGDAWTTVTGDPPK